jgi:DNA-binding phage protein
LIVALKKEETMMGVAAIKEGSDMLSSSSGDGGRVEVSHFFHSVLDAQTSSTDAVRYLRRALDNVDAAVGAQLVAELRDILPRASALSECISRVAGVITEQIRYQAARESEEDAARRLSNSRTPKS